MTRPLTPESEALVFILWGPDGAGELRALTRKHLERVEDAAAARERERWTVDRLARALHDGSIVCDGPPDGTCYIHRNQAARIIATIEAEP